MATTSFSLYPVVAEEDIPILAKYSAEAFVPDRQTQMKGQGKVPYDHEVGARDHMSMYFTYADRPTMKTSRLIKAVDEETGEIMGHAWFNFRNFDLKDVPSLEGKTQPPQAPAGSHHASVELTSEEAKQATLESISGPEAWKKFTDSDIEDPIKRLETLTGGDLNRWLNFFEPEGMKVIRIQGLTTAPKYQMRGVGSALLRWATSVADKHGVSCWVHSSEPAWGAYAKAGFKVVGTLDIDLDEYSPGPPPKDEGGDGKWGHYVFRMMKYFPKEV